MVYHSDRKVLVPSLNLCDGQWSVIRGDLFSSTIDSMRNAPTNDFIRGILVCHQYCAIFVASNASRFQTTAIAPKERA